MSAMIVGLGAMAAYLAVAAVMVFIKIYRNPPPARDAGWERSED